MQPKDGRIISNLIVQALSGKSLTIYGTGEQTRSFCFVSDLVAGLIALMQVDPNPAVPVNLGNPGEFSINELAGLVKDEIPECKGLVYRPLPQDDPKRRRPNIDRAQSLLNWSPKVPLHDGLRQTIDWFEQTLPTHPASRAKKEISLANLPAGE